MKTRAALALVVFGLLAAASLVMAKGGVATRLLWIAAALDLVVLQMAWRRRASLIAASGLLAVCGALALVAISRNARATPSTGDFAIIESYVFQALRGALFLGPYSRFRWHHPGPAYFFMLAPFYVLSGFRTAGVSAAALTINLASVAALSFVCLRRASGSLSVFVMLFVLAYVVRFEAILASQWNPHVLVLPAVALIAMAAAVASGWMELLPAVAFLAAFIVQTHLGLLPTVAAVVVATLVALFVYHRNDGKRLWRAINVSLWITLFLWFLPIADELAHTPGNLSTLWVFFLNNRAQGQPFTVAFQAWSANLGGLLVPGFIIAWGGQFVTGVSTMVQTWAVVQVAALAAIAWHPARHDNAREGFRSALAALLALASLVALWSVTRIEGDIFDHEIFWISGLGILNCALMAEALVHRWLAPRLEGRRAVLACGAVLLAVAVAGVSELRSVNERSFTPGDDEVAAETLSDEIVRYVHDERVSKVLLDVDGPAWAVAAGVAVQLEKAHIPYAVSDDAIWMFGDAAAPRGDEDETISIARDAHHAEVAADPGATLLATRRGFFADVIR